MCKEDPCKRLAMLNAHLEHMPTHKESSEIESPGTPSEPVIEPHLVSPSADPASSDHTAEHCDIFFARVPPLVPYEELFDLFSKFGTVADLNLFKRWATAKTSKGCGTVKYNCSKAASAALEALNGVHSFEAYVGCEGPMVVEWMDASRLTSADAAAAAKAAKAKAKAAAAAAAAAQKPQHSSKHRAKLHSSSSGPLPNRSYMQKLSALAQHYNSDSRAGMTAFAGAGTGVGASPACSFAQGMQGGSFVGGMHPALDALDLSGLLGSGPFSPDTGNQGITGSGLNDPSIWNPFVPVHLLPMMSKPHAATTMGPSNLAALNPMLPSAAFNQMDLSGSLLPSPAAAAAAAAAVLSPGSIGACGMERSLSAASAPSGAFGCATPSIEPWLSGGLPSRTNSTSLSFTSQGSSTFGAGGGSASFLVAAAAAAAEQQQIQQQAQQQMLPLMLLDDAWVNQSCDGLASGPTNLSNITQSNAGQFSNTGPASGSYGLFDNNSLLLQLNEAAAAAAGACAAANTINSNSILSAPCAGAGAGAGVGSSSSMVAGDVTFLSGRLSSVLTRLEGYMPMQGAGASVSQFASSFPAHGGANSGGSNGQQPAAKTAVHVPLSEAQFSAVVPHLISIVKMSGANVNTAGDFEEGSYELSIKGAPAEVEAAKNLVYLLSADS